MTSRTDVSVTLHCQPPCWFSSQGEQSPADLGKIFLRITQGMDERHTDQIDEAVFYQLSIVSFLILLVTKPRAKSLSLVAKRRDSSVIVLTRKYVRFPRKRRGSRDISSCWHFSERAFLIPRRHSFFAFSSVQR